MCGSRSARFLRPALLGWIAYALVKAFAATMEMRLETAPDPVAARSRRTRMAILSRTAAFAIVFITVGLMLLGIPGVRDIGTTLLASAGLAALAVGAAAQPALKSLIGGLQLALTEPLRIGDLVVVDGHTGRVEEIRMSFVTVRTWDERVVIVPTNRFLDQSFENWSRRSEMLTGPVFLPARSLSRSGAGARRIPALPCRTGRYGIGRTGNLLLTDAFPEQHRTAAGDERGNHRRPVRAALRGARTHDFVAAGRNARCADPDAAGIGGSRLVRRSSLRAVGEAIHLLLLPHAAMPEMDCRVACGSSQ